MFVDKGERGPPFFGQVATRVAFEEPFYVGIGVCAHNKDVTETARFSSVDLVSPLPSSSRPVLYSTLETQTMSSTDRRVVHVTTARIEAPNWLRDGKALIVNSGGRLLRIPVAGGKPEPIDTGFALRCNNDHGVSPDGTLLAISDQSQGQRKSLIYTLPVSGRPAEADHARPAPSYWHGWSPDGKTLAFGRRAARASSTSTPSPSTAAPKPASPPPRASTTAPSSRPTANPSTSTPSAPASCRSGG